MFQESFCIVDTYEFVSCDGPFIDVMGDLADPSNQLNAYGSPGPISGSICDDIFNFDTSSSARQAKHTIVANIVSNFFEGEYIFTIRGYNSVYNPTTFPGNE